MNLIQQADALATRVKQIVAFAKKYNTKLPDEVQGGFSIDTEGASYGYFMCHHLQKANHNKVLALYGDVFGRDGWTAQPDGSNRNFDWTKEVDGVKVKLWGAEVMPKLQPYVIPATKFPLQLTDEEISDAVPTDLAAV